MARPPGPGDGRQAGVTPWCHRGGVCHLSRPQPCPSHRVGATPNKTTRSKNPEKTEGRLSGVRCSSAPSQRLPRSAEAQNVTMKPEARTVLSLQTTHVTLPRHGVTSPAAAAGLAWSPRTPGTWRAQRPVLPPGRALVWGGIEGHHTPRPWGSALC